jgi:hypothetical protein
MVMNEGDEQIGVFYNSQSKAIVDGWDRGGSKRADQTLHTVGIGAEFVTAELRSVTNLSITNRLRY